MNRRRKILITTLLGICGFLALETFLPAQSQPTARVCLTLIDGYQAVGSPALKETGVRCKYTPSCSHYAEDAIGHYGTIEGCLRTGGRLFRCSPWGGNGYDPAVEEIAIQDQEPPKAEQPATQDDSDKRPVRGENESQQEYNQRLQEWNNRQAEKAMRELGKALGQGGAEAGAACALGAAGCIVAIVLSIISYVVIIIVMIWVFKDAKARGDQNAVLWLVLIFFLQWIGLIVYVVARPKGDIGPCANCKNSMMTTLTKCPHCGTESAGKPQA